MEAEDALTALARDLLGEVFLARSESVPEVPKTQAVMGTPMQAPPPARTGAGAVHPHLGHHLLTGHHGDTISGHAYAHVPKPYEVQQPDAKDLKLAEQKDQLEQQQKTIEKAGDHERAAKELDDHAADLESHGIPLPGQYKRMSPEETDTRHRYATDSVAAALKNGKATSVQHTLDGQGNIYTGDRAAMHRDLVHEALDQAVKVPSAWRGVLVGGLHHKAKQRVMKGHPELPEDQFLHVDPRRITDRLAELGLVPEVKGLSPGEASALVHDEAQWIAQLLLRAAMERGKNVAVHTPMQSAGAIAAHADRLRGAGYHVHGLFVHTPVDKAIDHAHSSYKSGVEKYRRQQGAGAPPALPGVLAGADRGATTAHQDAFEDGKTHLDSWEQWDNTDDLVPSGSSGPPAGHGIASAEELRKATR